MQLLAAIVARALGGLDEVLLLQRVSRLGGARPCDASARACNLSFDIAYGNKYVQHPNKSLQANLIRAHGSLWASRSLDAHAHIYKHFC